MLTLVTGQYSNDIREYVRGRLVEFGRAHENNNNVRNWVIEEPFSGMTLLESMAVIQEIVKASTGQDYLIVDHCLGTEARIRMLIKRGLISPDDFKMKIIIRRDGGGWACKEALVDKDGRYYQGSKWLHIVYDPYEEALLELLGG
ncbi:MAG: hypothetical protein ACPGWR_00890 [Ardenticatenaceae bacterium]